MSAISSLALNLGLVYGLLQSTYFGLEKEENVHILRFSYYGSQVIGLIVLLLIRSKIKAKKDKTKLTYVEQKNPFDDKEVETISTTCEEYDLSQLKQSFTQFFIGLGLITFLHFRSGFIRPLVLQSVLSFKNLWSAPLFQVYFLGKPTNTGDYKRPWKQNPFGPKGEEMTSKQLKAQEKKKQK